MALHSLHLSDFSLPNSSQIHLQITKIRFRTQILRCSSFAEMSTAGPSTVKKTIDLTPKEEKIFNRLIHVLKYFELDTQLRVAGGWVRDKILGKDCCGIDIALDDMSGREFCEKVNEYLKYAGEEQRGTRVIRCNPNQSKHLETARMRIYDTWIVFVNLRSETYVENSRIPTMKFGTTKEDAYKRDLPINSLFYNINTSSVEDFTGRGVQDMRNWLCVSFVDASWNLLQLTGPSKLRDSCCFLMVFGATNISFLADEQQRLYFYASLFLPLRNMVYTDRRSKKIPVTSYIFRSSLKIKSKNAEMVTYLFSKVILSSIALLQSTALFIFGHEPPCCM